VRRALERGDIEVVAVNDITDARTLAHLLAFDSTYGRLDAAVTSTDDAIIINGTPVAVLSSRNPAQIDWGKLGAAVVIESSGKFRARDQAALHLKGGARKVLLSAPGKKADLTVVVGVNDDSGLTQAAGNFANVFGWYDNEWGYTCRLADLTAIVGGRL
jgi:glyceraldehyde 3-phosphate dehydrogenase